MRHSALAVALLATLAACGRETPPPPPQASLLYT